MITRAVLFSLVGLLMLVFPTTHVSPSSALTAMSIRGPIPHDVMMFRHHEPTPRYAQDNGSARMELPVAVDGRLTPESVPDDVAYRLFLRSIATDEDAPRAVVQRRDAFLKAAGLSGDDLVVVATAMSQVQRQLKQLEQRRRTFDRASYVALATKVALMQIRDEERRTLDDACARIASGLAPDANTRLNAYVRDTVKRKITIYGNSQ